MVGFGCRRCLGVRSCSWQEKLSGLSGSLNWTIVVDAGICLSMTSDVTTIQCDFGHNFDIFAMKVHLPCYLLSGPSQSKMVTK